MTLLVLFVELKLLALFYELFYVLLQPFYYEFNKTKEGKAKG